MTTVESFEIPDEDAEWLRARAKKLGITFQELIVKIIRAGVEAQLVTDKD